MNEWCLITTFKFRCWRLTICTDLQKRSKIKINIYVNSGNTNDLFRVNEDNTHINVSYFNKLLFFYLYVTSWLRKKNLNRIKYDKNEHSQFSSQFISFLSHSVFYQHSRFIASYKLREKNETNNGTHLKSNDKNDTQTSFHNRI